MEDLKPVETLTPYEAARMIHANAEYIRAGLRSQRLPFVNFGSATPPKKPGGKWSYNIIKSKFLKEYAGIIGEYLIPVLGLLIILVIETIYEESESKKRGGKNGRK